MTAPTTQAQTLADAERAAQIIRYGIVARDALIPLRAFGSYRLGCGGWHKVFDTDGEKIDAVELYSGPDGKQYREARSNEVAHLIRTAKHNDGPSSHEYGRYVRLIEMGRPVELTTEPEDTMATTTKGSTGAATKDKGTPRVKLDYKKLTDAQVLEWAKARPFWRAAAWHIENDKGVKGFMARVEKLTGTTGRRTVKGSGAAKSTAQAPATKAAKPSTPKAAAKSAKSAKKGAGKPAEQRKPVAAKKGSKTPASAAQGKPGAVGGPSTLAAYEATKAAKAASNGKPAEQAQPLATEPVRAVPKADVKGAGKKRNSQPQPVVEAATA